VAGPQGRGLRRCSGDAGAAPAAGAGSVGGGPPEADAPAGQAARPTGDDGAAGL
jgi:hypothetical protein